LIDFEIEMVCPPDGSRGNSECSLNLEGINAVVTGIARP